MKPYIGDKKSKDKEIKSSRKYFFDQIKKGVEIESAFAQVENAYGLFFKECLLWDLQVYYKK